MKLNDIKHSCDGRVTNSVDTDTRVYYFYGLLFRLPVVTTLDIFLPCHRKVVNYLIA